MPTDDEPLFEDAAPAPRPWEKPPQDDEDEEGTYGLEGGGTGDAINGGIQGASLAGDIVSGAGDLAAGAIEGAGELAGAALEGAGGALEVAGGCAEGCGGCSLAVLVLLFAAAGSATALFR